MRILFLSRSLRVGGAERQLVALARGLSRRGHEISVAVFYAGGKFEEELRAGGIPIHDLSKRGRWDTVSFLTRLARLVRRTRPDILHGYMGGPNIYSAALKPLLGGVKVAWGLRSAMDDLSAYDWVTRVGPRLEWMASPLADIILANSNAARARAVAAGMSGAKIVVVPNGIDCVRFRPDPEGRRRQRGEWGFDERTPVVGIVARLEPTKNHQNFLRAAASVIGLRGDVRFVCLGHGDSTYKETLEQYARDLGISDRVIWASDCVATRAAYSAFDVAALASDSESFPNVVGEAMACGTPVVGTDAGDTPLIVGDTGVIVPRSDPAALARGMIEVLERRRAGGADVGALARARIEQEYSLEMLVTRTERELAGVAHAA